MPSASARARHPDEHRRLAFGVFLSGIAITAVTVAVLSFTAADRDRQTFEADASNAQDAVLDRVETSIALLRGAAGLFASHESTVTALSFRAYIARLALREQYPGLLDIGYSVRIAPVEARALEAEMRAQGHTTFRIWPTHEREEVHAIVYLEPLDERNRAAIGYDMYTNETRRAAMTRARDTGRVAASAIVELVQEIDERKQPGFLIYLPVYQGGVIPPTLEERRARLLGFAYSPIRAGDFLSSAFSHQTLPDLNFSVYHGSGTDSGSLLFEYAARPGGAARHTRTATVDVAGEPWTFVYRSRMTVASAFVMPLLAALAGMAFSLLLAVLVARETRARSEAQQALERERTARSEAERANLMKDQFLATLSHELRTPISAIVGWTNLLKRAGVEDSRVREAVEVIDRNARTQVRLIDDLLDMNGIMSGKLRMEMQPLDLAVVVGDALAVIGPSAQAKNVAIERSIDARPLGVRGDPARLQQIAWNLLTNAVKFTPPGGKVHVVLERADSRARLVVRDTGEGIAPAALERIFDRFAQADGSITRRHGGLGLGLAIVRNLVELHGGTVRGDSPGTGRGATFTVELPRVELATETATPGSPGSRAARQTLARLKMLVVDDERDAREFIRVALEECTARIRCVASAQEALDAYRELQPDVVVSDIGMPGMDGYELMRRIRASRPPGAPRPAAIALTAYAREQDRTEALSAGFDLHLTKPVRPDELIDVIARLTGADQVSA
ncbi:MAG: CHASE domain-containing protein [Betaproteobacteria bacterium]